MNIQDSGFALAVVGLGRTRGKVAMAGCPGRSGTLPQLASHDARSLQRDIGAIERWGAQVLVTLLDDSELASLHLQELPQLLSAARIVWHHAPLNPKRSPDLGFEETWSRLGRQLMDILRDGGKIAIHCQDGKTRVGMVTARLLIEAGCPPQDAINRVRGARPGAIEHPGLERSVLSYTPRFRFRSQEEPRLSQLSLLPN
jgi:ADP-ribosyl-[dinitrogen reductase] hydrolase